MNTKILKGFVAAIVLGLTGTAWAVEITEVDSKANAANSKADGNSSVIQTLETEIILLHEEIANITLIPGPAGQDGVDRTADLCALYHNLFDASLIGELTIPAYCNIGAFHHIGEAGPAGGIVFYVDETGMHGLEAAPADQSRDAEWGCLGTETGANGLAVGTGAQNTAIILAAACNDASSAASIASAYSLNGYNDWFLPSRDALEHLRQHQDAVGGFGLLPDEGFFDNLYWSSSENGINTAWQSDFNPLRLEGATFKSADFGVRAIRAF